VVRDRPVSDWQRNMSGLMAGPTSSPLFRDAATQMEVRYRLVVGGTEPMALSPEDQQRVLALTLSGATMGGRATVREIFNRSAEAALARKIVKTALSPGVMAKGGADGWSWEVDTPLEPGEVRILDDDEPVAKTVTRRPATVPLGPPPPTFRLGTRLRFLPNQTLASGAGEPLRFAPATVTTLQSTHLALDVLRIDLFARPTLGPRPPQAPPLTAAWSAAARQRVHPDVSLLGEAVGGERSAIPDRLRYGVELRPPEMGPFALVLSRSRPTLDPRPEERITSVVLRTNLSWVLPQSVDGWPLGQEPLSAGPTWPELGPAGPNRTEPLAGTAARPSPPATH
jgi:hypothetical protein